MGKRSTSRRALTGLILRSASPARPGLHQVSTLTVAIDVVEPRTGRSEGRAPYPDRADNQPHGGPIRSRKAEITFGGSASRSRVNFSLGPLSTSVRS